MPSWRSRFATRGSRPFRTSATSGSWIRRPEEDFTSIPDGDGCESASPRLPTPSGRNWRASSHSSECATPCSPPPATGSGRSPRSSPGSGGAMSFASPFVLWGLLLIPVALLAYWLVQRRWIRYAARFTNLDLLANIVDASPGRRRHIPAVFALAALAALIVAMARPQAVVAVPRDDATVVLTMDSSASMTATDVAPTRLEAAKSADSSFLDQLPERFCVGLVSFSSSVQVLEEPTDDRGPVRSSLAAIEGDIGTALGDAILTSIQLAPDPEE